MRQQIAQEGMEAVKGQIVLDGALTWPEDEKLPILYQTDDMAVNDFIGYASDIRREYGGVITAEIAWLGETVSYKGTSVFCKEASMTHDEQGRMIASAGRITHLFIAPDVPWADGSENTPPKTS